MNSFNLESKTIKISDDKIKEWIKEKSSSLKKLYVSDIDIESNIKEGDPSSINFPDIMQCRLSIEFGNNFFLKTNFISVEEPFICKQAFIIYCIGLDSLNMRVLEQEGGFMSNNRLKSSNRILNKEKE